MRCRRERRKAQSANNPGVLLYLCCGRILVICAVGSIALLVFVRTLPQDPDKLPPAALTFTAASTCARISLTSAKVAPAVENPVEVLMYSAPARVTISHIFIFSSSVSRQVSIMTFRIFPLQAS